MSENPNHIWLVKVSSKRTMDLLRESDTRLSLARGGLATVPWTLKAFILYWKEAMTDLNAKRDEVANNEAKKAYDKTPGFPSEKEWVSMCAHYAAKSAFDAAVKLLGERDTVTGEQIARVCEDLGFDSSGCYDAEDSLARLKSGVELERQLRTENEEPQAPGEPKDAEFPEAEFDAWCSEVMETQNQVFPHAAARWGHRRGVKGGR